MRLVQWVPRVLAKAMLVLLTWLAFIFAFIFYVGDWVVPWPDAYTRVLWVLMLVGLQTFLKFVWTPMGRLKKAIDWGNRLVVGGTGGLLAMTGVVAIGSTMFGGYRVTSPAGFAVLGVLLIVLGSWMLSWLRRHRHSAEDRGRPSRIVIASRESVVLRGGERSTIECSVAPGHREGNPQ